MGAGPLRGRTATSDGRMRRRGGAAFAGAAVPRAAFAGASFAAGASAAPSASTIATTLPSDNLSPTFTFNSTILPATLDGTSIVALSDSSVTRPLLHRVAEGDEQFDHRDVVVTADVGDLDFDRLAMCGAPVRACPRHIAEHLREVGGEARRGGAVDDAVVVAQRQRQHQARLELLPSQTGFIATSRHAEDRHFGRIDDRRERRAADAAERTDRETPALMSAGAELAVARLLASSPSFAARSPARPSGPRRG